LKLRGSAAGAVEQAKASLRQLEEKVGIRSGRLSIEQAAEVNNARRWLMNRGKEFPALGEVDESGDISRGLRPAKSARDQLKEQYEAALSLARQKLRSRDDARANVANADSQLNLAIRTSRTQTFLANCWLHLRSSGRSWRVCFATQSATVVRINPVRCASTFPNKRSPRF